MFSRDQSEPSHRPLLTVAAATLAGAAGAAWLLARVWNRRARPDIEAAHALGAGAAILCLSVALDSGLEHYRGRYRDPAMFVGPSMAVLGLVTSSLVASDPQRSTTTATRAAFATVAATGVVGLGFHAYNILKRPGQISALNLFYAAPAGAPAALTLAGMYGLIAGEMLTRGASMRSRLPSATARLIAFSLLGTVAEAGLLHFRGAFQDPAMYLPVTIPPAAAVAIAAAALSPGAVVIATPLLKATAVLGIAGPVFHAYGIHRNMGGWGNWTQMILQGPPLPAPPAFLGIAVAGLGLLPMLQDAAE